MVQFARGTLDHKEYAIKFFLDTDAFEAEATLLAAHMPALRSSLAWPLAARSAAVAADAVATASAAGASAAARASRHGADVSEQFLPLVAAISDGTAAALEDPKGHGLPPCVVTARGESLLEWSIRAAPDQFSSMAVRPPDGQCPTVTPGDAPLCMHACYASGVSSSLSLSDNSAAVQSCPPADLKLETRCLRSCPYVTR